MRINKKLKLLLLLSILLVVMLIVLLTSSGPRIRSIDYDNYELTRTQSPRIILRTNQKLNKDSHLTITIAPKVSYSSLISGESIIIELTTPLKYSTDYTFKVEGYQSESSGKKSNHEFSIITPEPSFLYIKRGSADSDTNDGVYITKITPLPKFTVLRKLTK